MAWKGVTAGDGKSLQFVVCILAISFCIIKELPAGTISRAWAAKYLKE